MESMRAARFICFVLFSSFASSCAYEIPDVRIEVLSPKGFRASIPHDPAITIFAFQGRINRPISKKDVGTLSGEIIKPTNGRWVYEEPNAQLKIGDVINYYVVVVTRTEGGKVKDPVSFTVKEYYVPGEPEKPVDSSCKPTVTKVRGGAACAGQVIFEDDFNSLREDVWQIQQFIPFNHPEYPFVSYQRLSSDPTVSVVDGKLRIAPKLQQDVPGFNNESIVSGSLNLYGGCTGSSNECSAQAWGASILPPVVSGRVVNKAFAFTYGTVRVRAKLPQGDWIYPEILLEPFLNKFDMPFSSGVLKIASARGNRDLSLGITDFSNKVLYGGPIMDFQCREYLLSEKKLSNGKSWGDDYHVYSVSWTPDRIVLLVDDEEWARIEPKTNGLHAHFPPTSCPNVPHKLLKQTGSKMAPFDDYFYLALGVAAGGITEFRDETYSNGQRKPWRNAGRKASLQFWESRDSWINSWDKPELLIDYVRVNAL